jgi:hypothetical protein
VERNHFGLCCSHGALWPCLKSISPRPTFAALRRGRQSGASTAEACSGFRRSHPKEGASIPRTWHHKIPRTHHGRETEE